MKNSIQLLFLKVYQQQTAPLLVVNTDKNRILFGGLFEPSTRYLNFYKVNPYDDNLTYFFTRSTMDHLDSISPLLLSTYQKSKFLGITFYGPSGISEFINSMSSSVGLKYIVFAAHDLYTRKFKYGISKQLRFIEHLKHDIKGVKTLEQTNQMIDEFYQQNEILDPLARIIDGYYDNGSTQVYPIKQGNSKSFSYLLVSQGVEKMNHKKMLDEKFPMPFVPELKKFGKITFKGRVYYLKDFILDSQHVGILVLDIKTDEEIENFHIEDVQQIVDGTGLQFLLVVHYADKEILEKPDYQKIVSQLSRSRVKTLHLITDDRFYDGKDTNQQRDKANFQHIIFVRKLNQLLPDFYPNPSFESDEQVELDSLWDKLKVQKLLYKKTFGIQIDEQLNVSFEKVYKLGPTQIIFTSQEQQDIIDCYKKVKESTKSLDRTELTLFGCNATVPTMQSNVQSFMVSVEGFRVLFDCGQNTFYQMYLKYGKDVYKTLSEIRVLLISHFHADHHLGLVNLISERIRNCPDAEPLYIQIPRNLQRWYEQHLTTHVTELKPGEKMDKYIRLLLRDDIKKPLDDPVAQELVNMIQKNKIKLDIFNVLHCTYSSGMKITDEVSGKTITFSSDKDGRNNEEINIPFVKNAKECDILVHECTFPDDSIKRAKEVFHSTFLQAIQTGVQTNAKTLVLTHYSGMTTDYIARMIDQDGEIDKEMFMASVKNMGADLQIDGETLFNYFQNKTVLGNDLLSVNTAYLPHMPKLSRLIFKVTPNQ